MNQNVRISLIGAVAGILSALIAAGATVWATHTVNRKEGIQVEKESTSNLEASADQTAQSSKAAATGGHEIVYVKSMTATVTSEHGPRTAPSPEAPAKADLCVLTSVGSYGGATKGCTLTRGNDGWMLVANARNSTSTCQATCFDLRPNGPPSP